MAAPRNTFVLKVGTNSLRSLHSIKENVQEMEGVENVKVYAEQQMVVITGTVRPDKVITMLHNKLGKKAELLPSTSIKAPPRIRRTGSQIVVGQSSNAAVNPLGDDPNKVAQAVGQLRRMIPGLAGVKIRKQIVNNTIEFRFNSS